MNNEVEMKEHTYFLLNLASHAIWDSQLPVTWFTIDKLFCQSKLMERLRQTTNRVLCSLAALTLMQSCLHDCLLYNPPHAEEWFPKSKHLETSKSCFTIFQILSAFEVWACRNSKMTKLPNTPAKSPHVKTDIHIFT